MMKMEDALRKRHTVRRYTDQKLSDSFIDVINERIELINQRNHLNMKLVVKDGRVLPLFMRLFFSKGAKNSIILCGIQGKDLDERIGFAGSEMMLFLQTLGLNSWWISGTYRHHHVKSKVKNKEVRGIIVLGYGESNGIPHKSKKTPLEVSTYLSGDAPEWFTNGVEAALFAPTGLNKQRFKITGNQNIVKIEYEGGMFPGIDKGIIKHHFEIGAGKDNFSWE